MKRLLIAAVLLVLCAAPVRPFVYHTFAGQPRVWFTGKATVNYAPGLSGSYISAINSSLGTNTRSPADQPSTPGPTSTISPATSRPMIIGSGTLMPGMPWHVKTSW